MNTPGPIAIEPAKIARFLGTFAIILIFCHIAMRLITSGAWHLNIPYDLLERFDLNKERTLPTFFQGLMLFVSSILLAIIAALNKTEPDHGKNAWALMSALMLFLSADELICIHERLGEWTNQCYGFLKLTDPLAIKLSSPFITSWVFIYLPAAFLIFLVSLKWLRRLPAKTRKYFLLAGALYVCGAAGCEMIQSCYWRFGMDHGNLGYEINSIVEEGLEMAGVIIFIWALLAYIANRFKNVQFELK